MTLIDRYIFKEFGASFVYSIVSFIAIFSIVDLAARIDFFIDKNVHIKNIALYYVGKSAETIELLIPLAFLLSALYTTGKLNKKNEILAVKASGISLYRMMVPYLLIAFIACGFNFYLSGWFVPEAKYKKKLFEEKVLEGKKKYPLNKSNFNLYDSPQRLLFIKYYSEQRGIFENVSIQEFKNTKLNRRIDAKSMTYNDSDTTWILNDAILRTFGKKNVYYEFVSRIDTISLNFTPTDILQSKQKPDELTLPEHQILLDLRQRISFGDVDEIKVKLYEKIAFPFACLVIPLIAVPLATRKRRSSLALETGISVALGFTYFGLQKSFATLGYTGSISAPVAAWTPNLIFFIVGFFLLWFVRK